MIKRISITGPESTGKSWLAVQLARHYKTICVPEFAVTYLEENGSAYELEDIEAIARGQINSERDYQKQASNLLFCDTDLLVTKIWSSVVFDEVPQWVESKLKSHSYHLFLLCFPDLKWENAPYRENPDDRDQLFALYEEELKSLGYNYQVVKGIGTERLKNAISFVDQSLNK